MPHHGCPFSSILTRPGTVLIDRVRQTVTFWSAQCGLQWSRVHMWTSSALKKSADHCSGRESPQYFKLRSHPPHSGPSARIFGGQTLAQCLYAFQRRHNKSISSLHLHFLMPVKGDRSIDYEVGATTTDRVWRVATSQEGVKAADAIILVSYFIYFTVSDKR